MARRVSILGSTGSVGQSTLSVIGHANEQGRDPVFTIDVLAGGQDTARLAEQAIAFKARLAVISDPAGYATLKSLLAGHDIEVAAGPDAVRDAATRPCDRLVAAIVGSAGVASTLAAVSAGTDVALANKESLIMAGDLIGRTAARTGSRLVPMDSEHSAIFQVLSDREAVEKVILTASGGPFRTRSAADMQHITVAEARNHPKWSMGLKISIDSATLFNKALEIIEAAYLFGMAADQIDVVVHPQSIIHSLVSYKDGTVLAQLGEPDMRTPIAYALSWPDSRIGTAVPRLDLAAISRLDFEPVDHERFPAVGLAFQALRAGGCAPLVLNCANEEAVAAFIGGECRFMDISSTVLETLELFAHRGFGARAPDTLEDISELETAARSTAKSLIRQRRD